MRRPLLAVSLSLLSLSGCVERGPSAVSPPGAPPDEATPPERETVGGEVAVHAPELPLGRAWTYAYESLYDVETEVTIVVAEGAGGGYLFAAGREDQLVGEVTWGREWFGPHDARLNYDNGRWKSVLFDFPLEDGKAWEAWEGVEVIARAATVDTPSGSEPGFVIEARTERSRGRWTYAPSVGYFTSYLWERVDSGVVVFRLDLKRVHEAGEWVWYEKSEHVFVGGAGEPAAGEALQVEEGYDSIVVSAGGAAGGRTLVTPPPPLAGEGPWAWQAPAEETWTSRTFPAHAGAWTLAAQEPGDGFAMLSVAAVKWMRGTVGGSVA